MDKKTLRKMLINKRKDNLAFCCAYSHKIIQKIIESDIYKKAKSIGVYVSLEEEISTFELLEIALKEKEVYVPKVTGDTMVMSRIYSLGELKRGRFNVLEPTSTSDVSHLDLMIVPMVGFDQKNYRIGYGKGYYDKYLSSHDVSYTIGISFSCLQVEDTMHDDYDIPLDLIITEAS